MDHFLQSMVSGIVIGGIYALIAMGFVIIYKATGIINFATGEFMMLGAFFCYTAMAAAGFPFAASLLLAVVGAGGLGMLVERVILRPLLGKNMISIIMVTIGLSSVFKGVAQLVWSGDYRAFPPIFPRMPILLGEIVIPSRQFYPFLIAIVSAAIIWLGFRFTRTGIAMRATADDQEAAFSMGIDIRRVFSLSWSLAAVTAALSGVAIGTMGGISPQLGAIGLKIFPVVILGGLDSIGGALAGGFLMGILENLAGGYLDPLIVGGGIKEVAPFVVLVVILMIRPYGLFGTREIERL